MGHYHRIVNLTQHSVIEPMSVGALDKLLEFGHSSGTAMAALWLLLGREAWCGDRIAILGYEGRARDLSKEAVAATGLDGTAYYCSTLTSVEGLAREVLVERGISSFHTTRPRGFELWHARPMSDLKPAGIDVVAADLDRRELIDPAQFGDSRDLHLAAAHGGLGGVTTALAGLLAASNRGGSRGGGDLRSRHPLVGAWAGDRIGVLPVDLARDFTDVSAPMREVLSSAEEASFEVSGDTVRRLPPPWWDRAHHIPAE